MQPSRARMGPPKYAPHPDHPVNLPKVRPFYRFMATGLGASMWFFVCPDTVVWKHRLTEAVDVPREERRSGIDGLETPVGPLNARNGGVNKRKLWTHSTHKPLYIRFEELGALRDYGRKLRYSTMAVPRHQMEQQHKVKHCVPLQM